MSRAKRKPLLRRRGWITFLLLIVLVVASKIWFDTMRAPVVRTIEISGQSDNLPMEGYTFVLLADLHVAGPDMPPDRVERIVEQVNGLNPDVILIAGDLVSDKRTATKIYPTSDALAPLAKLQPRFETIAVLGNHDHWRGTSETIGALENAGIIVLTNEAKKVGHLVIGGLDDDFTGHADLPRMLDSMEGLDGDIIVLSHSPDPFPDLPEELGIMVAGHTHCGQIAYPWGGSPATMSRYGQKYACGVVKENGNTLIASGGLGTSLLPIRLFTQPEIWLIKFRPPES